MNLIILIDKKAPSTPPLVFITPDTLDGDDFATQYPAETEGYYVTTIFGDQPSVVADGQGILDVIATDEG